MSAVAKGVVLQNKAVRVLPVWLSPYVVKLKGKVIYYQPTMGYEG